MLVLRQREYDGFYDDYLTDELDLNKGIYITSGSRNYDFDLGDKDLIDKGILEDIFENIFENAYRDYEDEKNFSILKDAKEEIKEDFDLDISITNLYKIYFNEYDIYDDEWCFEIYQRLFNKNYVVYESRGYNQGDFAFIVYDASLHDEKYINYIDCLLWGKYDEFDLIEDDDYIETYLITHDDYYNDETLKDYVKDVLDLKLDAIELIDGYQTLPKYESIAC